jgi:hypothetical protein
MGENQKLFVAEALAGITRGIREGMAMRQEQENANRRFGLEKRRLDIAQQRADREDRMAKAKEADPAELKFKQDQLQFKRDKLAHDKEIQSTIQQMEQEENKVKKKQFEVKLEELNFKSKELKLKFAALNGKDPKLAAQIELENLKHANRTKLEKLKAKLQSSTSELEDTLTQAKIDKLGAETEKLEKFTESIGEAQQLKEEIFGEKKRAAGVKEKLESEKFAETKRKNLANEKLKRDALAAKGKLDEKTEKALKLLGPVSERAVGEKMAAKVSIDRLASLISDPANKGVMNSDAFRTAAETDWKIAESALKGFSQEDKNRITHLVAELRLVTQTALKAKEGGRLSDADFERIDNVMAQISDTPDIALSRLQAFQNDVNTALRTTLDSAKRNKKDISGFRDVYEAVGGRVTFGKKQSFAAPGKKAPKKTGKARLQELQSKRAKAQRALDSGHPKAKIWIRNIDKQIKRLQGG